MLDVAIEELVADDELPRGQLVVNAVIGNRVAEQESVSGVDRLETGHLVFAPTSVFLRVKN
jgi:hypothetical protein